MALSLSSSTCLVYGKKNMVKKKKNEKHMEQNSGPLLLKIVRANENKV